jgi:hypothetical protein
VRSEAETGQPTIRRAKTSTTITRGVRPCPRQCSRIEERQRRNAAGWPAVTMLMVVIDRLERMAPRARAPQVRLRLLLFTGGETDVADSGDAEPLEVRVGVGHTYGKTERLRSVLPAGLPIELRHEAPRHQDAEAAVGLLALAAHYGADSRECLVGHHHFVDPSAQAVVRIKPRAAAPEHLRLGTLRQDPARLDSPWRLRLMTPSASLALPEGEVLWMSIHAFRQTRKCNAFCHLDNPRGTATAGFENIRGQLQTRQRGQDWRDR